MNKKAILLRTGCTAHCPFCNPRTPDSIGEDELKQIEADVYANIDYIKKHNTTSVEISGNDPAEYNKLPDLIRYLKDRQFDHIVLSSNAMKFSDYTKAEVLRDAGLDCVRIPVYGHTGELHEKIMGLPGSFDLQLEAIKNFLSLGLDIIFYVLITAYNKKNLVDIIMLFMQLIDNYSPKKTHAVKGMYFAMPCIPDYIKDDTLEYYLPYKNLKPYLLKLYNYLNQHKYTFASILDIPYCLLGRDTPFIHNREKKEALMELTGLQKPALINQWKRSNTIPTYRLKVNPDFCSQCRLMDTCAGFFVNDIKRFGIDEADIEILY